MIELTTKSRWQVTATAIVVSTVALLALFYSTAAEMVHTWSRHGTYAHGFVIVPISIWLVWQRRHHLLVYTPQPNKLFLILMFFGLAVWALARLTGVLVVEELAFVGVIITSIATLIGWQATKFLAFPLLFLFFAVPMGEDLVPPMMEFTATFTVAAIKLSGIPVYRDGLWFSLPSGNWSVVEACSGVRYLIASVTLGVMYAYITYHTLWKRLLFIVMSALVPILANGIRAYMIVMIGHFSNMKYATGVDHLIYGWVFFGVVMFILFWIGSFWQEEQEPPEFVAPEHLQRTESVASRLVLSVLLIIGSSAAIVWMTGKAEGIGSEVVASFAIPERVADWEKSVQPTLWRTRHQETPYAIRSRYRSVDGDDAQLFVALFPQQRQGSEAITQDNRVAEELIRESKLGTATVDLEKGSLQVNQSKVVVPTDSGEVQHLVWQWYRVAGHSVVNAYRGKAWEALARISPGRTDGAWVVITTALEHGDASMDEATERLRTFARAAVPEVNRSIDRSLGF